MKTSTLAIDPLTAMTAQKPVGKSFYKNQRGLALTRDGLLVLAATACAGLPLLRHTGALELAALIGVASIGTWAAWRQSRSRRAADAPATHEPPPASPGEAARLESLNELLKNILPVWLHHVESVKSQTEDAITQLAVSFSSMTEQFEAAGFKGASGSQQDLTNANHGATISLLTLCERELQPVIQVMSKLLDGKGAMAAAVKELSLATDELQGMASGIGQIAAQTNLLAINAAIEAARAGDAGRGFGVIAKEIRSLSQVSAQTGKQINARVEQVARVMKTTVDAASRAAEHDQSAIELSGGVVEDVLSHVRTLSASAETMHEQGNVIRGDVENLLVSLQFQDRVSQMISVIDSDIKRLRDSVESGQSLPDAGQWLSDLEQLYTMNDQRQNHAANDAAQPARAGAPEPAGVEFF